MKGLYVKNYSKTFKTDLVSQKIFMCLYRKMGYMSKSLVFINVDWFIYKIVDSLIIQITTIIVLFASDMFNKLEMLDNKIFMFLFSPLVEKTEDNKNKT